MITPKSNPKSVPCHPKLNRRHAILALAGSTLLSGIRSAEAKFETYQIPTKMTVDITPSSATRGVKVTATAILKRLDTDAGVPSAELKFYFGNTRSPTSLVGTKFTNSNGVATISFTISNSMPLGQNVLVVQFLGNNRFAQPLPYDFINIVAARDGEF